MTKHIESHYDLCQVIFFKKVRRIWSQIKRNHDHIILQNMNAIKHRNVRRLDLKYMFD